MQKIQTAFGKVIFPPKKKASSHRIKEIICRIIAPIIGYGVFGYFFGRVLLFGQFNPLGITAVAAMLGGGWNCFLTALGAFWGYTQSGLPTGAPMYLMALSALGVGEWFLVRGKKLTTQQKALGCAVSLWGGGAAYAIFEGGSLFLFVRAGAEGVLGAAVTFLLGRGMTAWSRYQKGEGVLAGEDFIALSLMAILALGGVMTLGEVGYGLALGAAVAAVLLAVYIAGSAGVAAAAVAGICFLALGRGSQELFLLLVMGALAALFFRRSRAMTVASFALGAAIPAFYLSAWPDSVGLWALFLGMALFLAVPKRYLAWMPEQGGLAKSQDTLSGWKEAASARLEAFGEAILALADVFPLAEREELTPAKASEVVEETARQACQGCQQEEKCWQGRKFTTYEAIYRLTGAAEERGRITAEDLAPLMTFCCHPQQVQETALRLTRQKQQELFWKNRFSQTQALVHRQIDAIGMAAVGLADELIPKQTLDPRLSDKISQKLQRQGIQCQQVKAGEDENGMWVLVQHPACRGKNRCRAVVALLLTEVTGRGFVRQQTRCQGKKDGLCRVVFREETGLSFFSSCASATRQGSDISGDSSFSFEMPGKKGVLLLSDGMGSGRIAAQESRRLLELMRRFLEAGFPLSLGMETINAALAVRANEVYATLDVCAVDLKTGQLEVVKNGGATVFLRQGERVRVIRSSSLPLGVTPSWQGESSLWQMKSGDLMLLISDGIADAFGQQEERLVEELIRQAGENISWLCDAVLQVALQRTGGMAKDDMTAVAGKVE